ncbi:MAG: sugar kinase [Chloroflexi bacterium]|nr:sugar kinase [Chloroflexota bacterium]
MPSVRYPTREARRYDVISFGEAMVRLTPPDYQRLELAHSLDMAPGGAELNTVVTLSRLGRPAAWVSALPDNPLGRFITNQARLHGVDTSHVVWPAVGKCGVYFLEMGAPPRPPTILYDRQDTAIALLPPDAIDWPALAAQTRVLHTTGITPALSANARAHTAAAMAAARATGGRVTFDVNYRARLWSPAEARAALEPLLHGIDVLFSSLDDLRTIFGFSGEPAEIAAAARERFDAGIVCTGLRGSATDRRSLVLADRPYESAPTHFTPVDPLGAGDAYAGGFLSGWLDGDLERAIALGDALAAIKHTMPGDFLTIAPDEVERYLAAGSSKVQR